MKYALLTDAIVPRHGSSVCIKGLNETPTVQKDYIALFVNTGLTYTRKTPMTIRSSGGIATLRITPGDIGMITSTITSFWTAAGTIEDAEMCPKTTIRIPYGYYVANSPVTVIHGQSYFEINPDGSLVFYRGVPGALYPGYVDTIVASYLLE